MTVENFTFFFQTEQHKDKTAHWQDLYRALAGELNRFAITIRTTNKTNHKMKMQSEISEMCHHTVISLVT